LGPQFFPLQLGTHSVTQAPLALHTRPLAQHTPLQHCVVQLLPGCQFV
jgi:hypothetical protein